MSLAGDHLWHCVRRGVLDRCHSPDRNSAQPHHVWPRLVTVALRARVLRANPPTICPHRPGLTACRQPTVREQTVRGQGRRKTDGLPAAFDWSVRRNDPEVREHAIAAIVHVQPNQPATFGLQLADIKCGSNTLAYEYLQAAVADHKT